MLSVSEWLVFTQYPYNMRHNVYVSVGNPSGYTRANAQNLSRPHNLWIGHIPLSLFLSRVSVRRNSLDYIVTWPKREILSIVSQSANCLCTTILVLFICLSKRCLIYSARSRIFEIFFLLENILFYFLIFSPTSCWRFHDVLKYVFLSFWEKTI